MAVSRRPQKRKSAPQFKYADIEPYLGLGVRYSYLWIPVLAVLFFYSGVVRPKLDEVKKINRTINEKTTMVNTVTAGKARVEKIRQELVEFKFRVDEFEGRLPERLTSNLILETLQELTKRTDLQFSSLEPSKEIRHVLEKTRDVFIELPVRITLKSDYYDLIQFLKNIETAKQFMKITDLSIKNNPVNEWEHAVQFSVRTFSREIKE